MVPAASPTQPWSSAPSQDPGLNCPLTMGWRGSLQADDWGTDEAPWPLSGPRHPTSSPDPVLAQTHLRVFHLSFSVWFSGLSLS